MMAVAVKDWGEAMMTSFTGALALMFSAIPRIIGQRIGNDYSRRGKEAGQDPAEGTLI